MSDTGKTSFRNDLKGFEINRFFSIFSPFCFVLIYSDHIIGKLERRLFHIKLHLFPRFLAHHVTYNSWYQSLWKAGSTTSSNTWCAED